MEGRVLLQMMTNTRIFIVKGHGHTGLKDGVRREPKPEVSCINGIMMRVANSFYDPCYAAACQWKKILTLHREPLESRALINLQICSLTPLLSNL